MGPSACPGPARPPNHVTGETHAGGTVIGGQGQVGEGAGHASRRPFLPGRVPGHRGGGVDPHGHAGVLFALVEAHQQAAQAGVGAPVEPADVVAGDVRPVVGQVERTAVATGTSLAGAGAHNPAPGRQSETVERPEQFRRDAEGSGITPLHWRARCRHVVVTLSSACGHPLGPAPPRGSCWAPDWRSSGDNRVGYH